MVSKAPSGLGYVSHPQLFKHIRTSEFALTSVQFSIKALSYPEPPDGHAYHGDSSCAHADASRETTSNHARSICSERAISSHATDWTRQLGCMLRSPIYCRPKANNCRQMHPAERPSIQTPDSNQRRSRAPSKGFRKACQHPTCRWSGGEPEG